MCVCVCVCVCVHPKILVIKIIQSTNTSKLKSHLIPIN